MKKEKIPLIILIAAVAGVLLLAFGGGGEEKATTPLDAEYLQELEESVKTLVSAVRGVSECEVKITLASGYGYEYSSRGDVAAVLYPKVCGVGIVCKGGDVPRIRLEITSLVSAALGVSSAQISVTGK